MTTITPENVSDNLEQAEEYHNQAYRLLVKHEIPPTPTNYTVAYEFAAKRHPELNEAITRRLERDGLLDSYFFLSLFERYFMRDSIENLDHHVTDIHEILRQALQGISSASEDFSSYERLLENKIVELHQDPDMQAFKLIAANLLQATQATLSNSSRLSTHLDASNQEIRKLQTELDEIRQEAYTDALTGLFNRKALTCKLDQLVEVTTNPLSVLMLDIDHFKRFNDNYGHLIGDEVIRRVAATLKQYADTDTIAARYGGEEFTLVLPNTGIEQAMQIAKAIHTAVAGLVLVKRKTQERLPGITISVGAACMKQGEQRDDLLERADQALYLAKCSGRNRVISELQLCEA
jgi:diguanylate cyclase